MYGHEEAKAGFSSFSVPFQYSIHVSFTDIEYFCCSLDRLFTTVNAA
jgi:hypothetical protein